MGNTLKPINTKYGYLPESKFPEVVYTLPIHTPNIQGQRYCDDNEIANALATRNGYDKGLYRPVFAVAILKEVAKVWISLQPKNEQSYYDDCFKHNIPGFEDYAIFLFDGKHRGRQLISVDPGIKNFPIALIYRANTVERGNWYFNQFNVRSLTKVEANSIFINDFLAGSELVDDDPYFVKYGLTVSKMVSNLKKVGLTVVDKKDFMTVPLEAKKNKQIPAIDANPWKLFHDKDWHPDFSDIENAIQIYHEMLEESVDYQNALAEEDFTRFSVNSWIIHGLATLLRHRPKLLDKPEPRTAFVKSLARVFDNADMRQSRMLKDIKGRAIQEKDGGLNIEALELNSRKIYAVALAWVFNHYAPKYGIKKGALPSITKVSDLYQDIVKDENDRKEAKKEARKRKAA